MCKVILRGACERQRKWDVLSAFGERLRLTRQSLSAFLSDVYNNHCEIQCFTSVLFKHKFEIVDVSLRPFASDKTVYHAASTCKSIGLQRASSPTTPMKRSSRPDRTQSMQQASEPQVLDRIAV